VAQIIGEILPLALGIAISPIPIIATILMLLSPKAKSTSAGFLLGWLIGIVAAVVVFTLLSALIPRAEPGASNPVAGTIKIVLGLLLLLLAVRQWRMRPRAGVDAALPRWMAAIDTVTVVRSLLLGVTLAALNPKNLLLAVGAGVAVGAEGTDAGTATIAIVVFTLVAASTVATPIVAYLVAAARMKTTLESLRGWLVHNNATVMSILMLFIGVVMLGKGIGSL
jgi:threonine/homoserine/homoserine lactone efflux protein